jgi:chromosome partitioning protein
MSYIIAIGNQKGGVAKTTTAVSLSAALVEHGFEVLAVDLDPQANLSLALGIKSSTLRRGTADVLLGNDTVLGVSRETHLPGLDLLPANPAMHLVDKYLMVRPNYEQTLRAALAPASAYNVVVIDGPPGLGPLSTIAWTTADLLIIPTQCEYFSAHGLNDVLRQAQRVRDRHNPKLECRLLVTMFDRRNSVHHTILQQLRQTFGDSALNTAIEVDTKLRESPVFGQPITRYAPNSRAAQQYRALAEELSVYVQREKTSSAT